MSNSSKNKNNIDLLNGTILYDNILIEPIDVEKSSLIKKPKQYEDKAEWGKVVNIGKGRIFDNGTVIPLIVKKGDVVYFQKYSAQKLRYLGKDYLLIREEDIFYINR